MNGVLVIDKPAGITSHDVIYRVRRILKIKSVGHTGTLDPFATGVLVVLIGRATKLAQFLDKAEKEYLATIRFGCETDTGDRTGTAKSEISDFKFQTSDLEIVLSKFRGEIWQTPPMYSAKKIAGKKLYELARQGETIERQPIKVNVSKLEVAEIAADRFEVSNLEPEIALRAAVSAGTYIRALAEDIGGELGAGAHLSELRRTRAGSFDLSQAVTLEELERLASENSAGTILIAPNAALAALPQIVLTPAAVAKTLHGQKLFVEAEFENDAFVRLCDADQNLVAVGVYDKNRRAVQPRTVIAERAD